MNWEGIGAYAFPPIALISRVLLRLTGTARCRMTLICLQLAKTVVVPCLLSLLSANPLILPQRKDLIGTAEGLLPMETIQAINLTAWPLSSDPTERQAFQ